MRKLIELHFVGGEKVVTEYPMEQVASLMNYTEPQQVPGAVADTVIVVNPTLITYARQIEE